MAKIFLSYRRADGVASGARSLIYQKLQEHYGPRSVFMDVERMQVARDFRECLHDELINTDVMLVLIGPQWAELIQQRAGVKDDFVRIEIETALLHQKPVLPLLLGGAQMPTADQVPDSIKPFTFNHGVELDTGRYFNEGMARLCNDLDEHIFKGHISHKKLSKGAMYSGIALTAAVIVSLITLKFGENTLQPDMERTAASAENIADSTTIVAESSVIISENTQEMAKSLTKIAVSFEALKTDGVIDKPSSSNEFYHNASIYELNGDYTNARRSYLGYFKFKEDKIDPHLRFISMLKVQEGLPGARETYAVVAKTFPANTVAPLLAKSLLYRRAQRITKLQQLAATYPDYAPIYHFLALDYSADRLGARSIGDMRQHKRHLTRFQELDSEGKLLRHFVDQATAASWQTEATTALKYLESQMSPLVLENPVRLTWMKHNTGWVGSVGVAEATTRLSWKTAAMANFKTTPMSDTIDIRTGKPIPRLSFDLPVKQTPTKISVKYSDRNGTQQGPFEFDFEPSVESLKNDIQMLQMTSTGWLSFRDFNDSLLLYFSTLLSYRGAIEKITYGLDKEIPTTNFPFPAWNKPGMALISDEVLIHTSIPKETKFATVQLIYKNGDKSDVVRFERDHR